MTGISQDYKEEKDMKRKYKGTIVAITVMVFLSLYAMVMPAIAQDTTVSNEIEKSLSDNINEIDSVMNPLSQDEFLGTWVNVESTGMIKFEITPDGSDLVFHGYGDCSPPCDWGSEPLILFSSSVVDTDDTRGYVYYDFGFKITRIFLTMINSNLILANSFDEFTDGSGRHNYYSDEYFVKCGSISSC